MFCSFLALVLRKELDRCLADVSLAMFQMLENLPLTGITSFLGIWLVLVFFVTSSDSGSLVVDSITVGGKMDAPRFQRMFWATLQGLIAACLPKNGRQAAYASSLVSMMGAASKSCADIMETTRSKALSIISCSHLSSFAYRCVNRS